MFEMISGIGETLSRVGVFFFTIWDSIKSLFLFIWDVLNAIAALLYGFPVWLATLIFFSAMVSIILWLTLNR